MGPPVEPPSKPSPPSEPDALKAALLSLASPSPIQGESTPFPLGAIPGVGPESVHNALAQARVLPSPLVMSSDVNNRRQSIGSMGPPPLLPSSAPHMSDNPRKRKLEGFLPPGSGGGGSALARGQDSGASVSGLFDQMEFDYAGPPPASGEFRAGGRAGCAGRGGGGGPPRPRPAGNKAPRRGSKEKGKPTMCRCDNSGCLKRYCVCFAAGGICHDGCKCKNCANDEATAERKAARDKAIAAMMAKKRDAFEQRVGVGEGGEQILHTIGCNCKKSGCRKRYCECYQGGVACHEKCKCFGCENPAGQNPRSRDSSLIPVAKVGGGGGGGAIPGRRESLESRASFGSNGSPGNRASIPGLEHVPSPGMADLLSAAAAADGDGLLSLDGTSPPKGRRRASTSSPPPPPRARARRPPGRGAATRPHPPRAPWRRPPRSLPARWPRAPSPAPAAARGGHHRDAARRDGEGALETPAAIGSTGGCRRRPAPRPPPRPTPRRRRSPRPTASRAPRPPTRRRSRRRRRRSPPERAVAACDVHHHPLPYLELERRHDERRARPDPTPPAPQPRERRPVA